MYQCTREHVYNKVFNILLGTWALFQTQGGKVGCLRDDYLLISINSLCMSRIFHTFVQNLEDVTETDVFTNIAYTIT